MEKEKIDDFFAVQTDILPPEKKSFGTVMLLGVVVLILVGLWFCFHFGRSQDVEEVKDSVVMVEVYNSKEEMIVTGSGFCVFEHNWIATNFHVIEGARDIKVVTDSHEKLSVNNVVCFNKEQDLAIIQIDGELTPLKLGDDKSIGTKDDITTIGSPKGELNTVSEGIVSNADDRNQIRITAPISHGSSGGVLLNKKNEVIGITSAGYEDAQNLNFAIRISLLEELYEKYQTGSSVSITKDSLFRYMGSFTDFFNYLGVENRCYTVSSVEVFHKLTNSKTRFETLLENRASSWFEIYNSLNGDDQQEVVALFAKLAEREFSDSDILGDIQDWGVTDFFISLGVLNRYEYAIVTVDISNYTNEDALFENVNDNYPLDAAEKSLILYLLGNYDWSDIHTDNKEDIFYYFDAKYSETRELGAILELLGYDVVYENDGTLTGYW